MAASCLSISYYSSATGLIHLLNWASGQQSLSPLWHQSEPGCCSGGTPAHKDRTDELQKYSYRRRGNLQVPSSVTFSFTYTHLYCVFLLAFFSRCFSQWIHHLPLPLINIYFLSQSLNLAISTPAAQFCTDYPETSTRTHTHGESLPTPSLLTPYVIKSGLSYSAYLLTFFAIFILPRFSAQLISLLIWRADKQSFYLCRDAINQLKNRLEISYHLCCLVPVETRVSNWYDYIT